MFFFYPNYETTLIKGSGDGLGLSIFDDQSMEHGQGDQPVECGSNDHSDANDMAFGKFIERKWLQVQRSSKADES